jgi:DNA-binding CsgD family transcriptional regulator
VQRCCARIKLSPREGDIAKLSLQGLRVKEIAGSLGISENSVKAHKRRLYEALSVHTNVELVIWAQVNPAFAEWQDMPGAILPPMRFRNRCWRCGVAGIPSR